MTSRWTSGLTRDEVRQLLAVARAHSRRSACLILLLVLNGLRISEALDAKIEDLDYDQGHRVLRIKRKGGKRAKTPLTPDDQPGRRRSLARRSAARRRMASLTALLPTPPFSA